ncbi:hypothetical protein PF008_g27595 [Phytophthora fragariae]|uniref:Secreted protein n=1 Tax=Phytophthora fragariae TaxID=53985 RepID=A0A6G0QDP3_9STRA|nr:hypothetical protein PF008_g27595 [Phytophthora fragariae]
MAGIPRALCRLCWVLAQLEWIRGRFTSGAGVFRGSMSTPRLGRKTSKLKPKPSARKLRLRPGKSYLRDSRRVSQLETQSGCTWPESSLD